MEICVYFTDVYSDSLSRLHFTNEAVNSDNKIRTCEFLGHEVSIQFRLSNEKVQLPLLSSGLQGYAMYHNSLHLTGTCVISNGCAAVT